MELQVPLFIRITAHDGILSQFCQSPSRMTSSPESLLLVIEGQKHTTNIVGRKPRVDLASSRQ